MTFAVCDDHGDAERRKTGQANVDDLERHGRARVSAAAAEGAGGPVEARNRA